MNGGSVALSRWRSPTNAIGRRRRVLSGRITSFVFIAPTGDCSVSHSAMVWGVCHPPLSVARLFHPGKRGLYEPVNLTVVYYTPRIEIAQEMAETINFSRHAECSGLLPMHRFSRYGVGLSTPFSSRLRGAVWVGKGAPGISVTETP